MHNLREIMIKKIATILKLGIIVKTCKHKVEHHQSKLASTMTK